MMKRRFRARRFSASGSLMSFRLKVRSLREVPEPPFGAGALRLRGAKNGGVVNGKFPDAGLCAVGTQHRRRAVSASRPAELCACGEQNEKAELTKGHMTRSQLRGEPRPVDSLSGAFPKNGRRSLLFGKCGGARRRRKRRNRGSASGPYRPEPRSLGNRGRIGYNIPFSQDSHILHSFIRIRQCRIP